jgi:hypothetical protein
MKETSEMLEILIGKFLDGEITPSEQRMLEAELEQNPQAKELLEQLQQLHERSCEVVCSEVLEKGEPAEQIFERAWQQSRHPLRRAIQAGGYVRFAAGLAAGLVIGLSLHFTLLARLTAPSIKPPPTVVARNVPYPLDAGEPDELSVPSDRTQDVIRNVDWFNFTDDDGDQWVIEGLRENIVRPVAYSGDL